MAGQARVRIPCRARGLPRPDALRADPAHLVTPQLPGVFCGAGDGIAEHSYLVESTNLAPGLLLAMPQLADPNFARAVILMIEHSEQGSMGLVVNHPSPIKATELLDSLEMSWHGEDSAVVWAGGPVSPSTGWVLHEPLIATPTGAGTIEITSTISLSTSPDRLRMIASAPPRNVRLLLGYAGWGPGQLAGEMARGAWLHTAVDPQLVFDTPPEHMWEAALRSLGINPKSLFTGRGVN